MSSLINVTHPSRYHGFRARAPYFEGWYFKLVSADEKHRYAIIPGVYHAVDPEKSHAFVQVFNSDKDTVTYHRYPFEAFRAARDRFYIEVGPNSFSAQTMVLAIDDDLGQVRGQLHFSATNGWPTSFLSPGAMGWFAWVPFMECYHGVVSFDHVTEGSINHNGDKIDFSAGRGYIEKDWGKQFPSAWIWGQSNHFEKSGVSLMMSVAVVPWLFSSFGGFVIGLWMDGSLHRFATYNGSRIESLQIADREIELIVSNRTHRLRISAERMEGGLLQAPTLIEMDRRIIETINATLEVRLEKKTGEHLFHGIGRHAGLETVGDLALLMHKVG